MFKSWFYNLSLAAKMFIAFSFVLAFALGIGLFSLYQLGSMGDMLRELAAKYHIAPEVVAKEMQLFDTFRYLTIGLMIFSIVACSWLTHFIVKTVTCKSLWYALVALEKIADGDLRQNINVKSQEEIG